MGIVIGKVGAILGITVGILSLIPFPFTFNPFIAIVTIPASILGFFGCYKAEKGNRIGIIIMFLSAFLIILPAFFHIISAYVVGILLGLGGVLSLFYPHAFSISYRQIIFLTICLIMLLIIFGIVLFVYVNPSRN